MVGICVIGLYYWVKSKDLPSCDISEWHKFSNTKLYGNQLTNRTGLEGNTKNIPMWMMKNETKTICSGVLCCKQWILSKDIFLGKVWKFFPLIILSALVQRRKQANQLGKYLSNYLPLEYLSYSTFVQNRELLIEALLLFPMNCF